MPSPFLSTTKVILQPFQVLIPAPDALFRSKMLWSGRGKCTKIQSDMTGILEALHTQSACRLLGPRSYLEAEHVLMLEALVEVKER